MDRFEAQDKNSWKTETVSFADRFGAIDNRQLSSPKAAEAPASLPPIALHDGIAKGTPDPGSRSVVVVDKTNHLTHVLQMNHGRVEDVLTVNDATGKSAKSTPEGRFHVLEKELHPWWYPPKSIGGHPVPPGPDNPLGPAKIRTDYPGGKILLHGTSRPDQIGTNASHGCIRHNNKDIMKIYPLVEKGDAIYIVKNFNSATIRPEDFGRRR